MEKSVTNTRANKFVCANCSALSHTPFGPETHSIYQRNVWIHIPQCEVTHSRKAKIINYFGRFMEKQKDCRRGCRTISPIPPPSNAPLDNKRTFILCPLLPAGSGSKIKSGIVYFLHLRYLYRKRHAYSMKHFQGIC